jgi:cytochrome b561
MNSIDTLNMARYTRTAAALHWLLALLLLANVALALSVDLLPDDWVRPAIDSHKSLGITALGLVLLRLLWRASHRPPPLPQDYAVWERRASQAAHALLYLVMLALPLSGWLHDSAWKDAATHPMHWFGLFEWPRIGFIMALPPAVKEGLHDAFGSAHTLAGYALYALLTLHVAGALKHQWLDRQPELQRMALFRRGPG